MHILAHFLVLPFAFLLSLRLRYLQMRQCRLLRWAGLPPVCLTAHRSAHHLPAAQRRYMPRRKLAAYQDVLADLPLPQRTECPYRPGLLLQRLPLPLPSQTALKYCFPSLPCFVHFSQARRSSHPPFCPFGSAVPQNRWLRCRYSRQSPLPPVRRFLRGTLPTPTD